MIAIHINTVCKRSLIVLSPDNYVMICSLLQTMHVTERARVCVYLCGRRPAHVYSSIISPRILLFCRQRSRRRTCKRRAQRKLKGCQSNERRAERKLKPGQWKPQTGWASTGCCSGPEKEAMSPLDIGGDITLSPVSILIFLWSEQIVELPEDRARPGRQLTLPIYLVIAVSIWGQIRVPNCRRVDRISICSLASPPPHTYKHTLTCTVTHTHVTYTHTQSYKDSEILEAIHFS